MASFVLSPLVKWRMTTDQWQITTDMTISSSLTFLDQSPLYRAEQVNDLKVIGTGMFQWAQPGQEVLFARPSKIMNMRGYLQDTISGKRLFWSLFSRKKWLAVRGEIDFTSSAEMRWILLQDAGFHFIQPTLRELSLVNWRMTTDQWQITWEVIMKSATRAYRILRCLWCIPGQQVDLRWIIESCPVITYIILSSNMHYKHSYA